MWQGRWGGAKQLRAICRLFCPIIIALYKTNSKCSSKCSSTIQRWVLVGSPLAKLHAPVELP